MYRLVEIRRFGSAKVGFMIPIFSRIGSNESFAQDLDTSGRVRRFLPIRVDRFQRFDWLPPHVELAEGDLGVLVFVDDLGASHIGNITDIAQATAGAEIANPFVKLEVASLIGDLSRFRAAVKECQEAFVSMPGSDNWALREEKSFDKIQALWMEKGSSNSKDEEKLAKDLRLIEEDFRHEKWVQIWLRLWQQDYRRDRLVGLIAFAIDTDVELPVDAAQIFGQILRVEGNGLEIERALKFLSHVREVVPSVCDLYYQLHYVASVDQRLRALESVIRILDASMHSDYRSRRSWLRLWSMASQRSASGEDLHRLAVAYSHTMSVLSLDAAEVLLGSYLHNERRFEEFRDAAVMWLGFKLRSSLFWAEVYLSCCRYGMTDSLFDIGLRWLSRFGGNTKSWVRIWSLFSSHMDLIEHRRLAIGWLRRARWDMKAWPDLFAKVVEGAPFEQAVELHGVGSRWLSSGYGRSRSRRAVKQALDYLSTVYPIADAQV